MANLPAALADEVTFLSGLGADRRVAPVSFFSWNYDAPPTYGSAQSFKWGGTTPGTRGGIVTYAFDPASGWSAAEKQVFMAGFALWSDEANIRFVPVRAATADVTIYRNSTGDAYETETEPASTPGAATLPNPRDMIITIDSRPSQFGPIDKPFAFQSYPLSTVVHEEGHALGLGHAGPYDGTVPANTASAQLGPYDQQSYSIMSYIATDDGSAPYFGLPGPGASLVNAQTPMIADILAAQRLYGEPVNTALAGGQVFGFNCNVTDASRLFFDFTRNTQPQLTLFDTGGDNTLDLSGFTSDSVVDLEPGHFSSCAGLVDNIAIDVGTAIDGAVCGSGNDTIVGNTDNNWITGGAGDDIMTGGGGHDHFIFDPGSGNDLVTDFHLRGPSADVLDVQGSGFSSVADLLSHATVGPQGVTIAFDAADSVTLAHVGLAALLRHPGDVKLA